MKGFFKKLLMGLTPFLLAANVGTAADEPMVRADEASSEAIIVRVPLDEQGRELREAAELRIYKGPSAELSGNPNLEDIWARSIADESGREVDDGSTRFFWWRPYYYRPYGYYGYYYYYPYYGPYYPYGW